VRKMRVVVLGVAAALIGGIATAQPASDPLPRRGYFGVGLEQTPSGARVTSVAAGSTAAAAGVIAGDIILAIDDRATPTMAAVVGALGHHRGGDAVSVRVQRNEDIRTTNVTLKVYPSEQMPNAVVSYESVESLPGVRLRTITSVPQRPVQERYPAVLFIQGGGCNSIETPIGLPVGTSSPVAALGSRGYVTMRVEKSGIGDSQGEPCAAIGFIEELAGYQAALKALLLHPSVDRDRVYLVTISLGGVFAPLLAAETHVAGITVWGTPAGPTPPYPGRSERFFQEFAKADIAGAWAKVNTRVDVLHGEYDTDPVVSRAAHESLTATINKAHPGSATFLEFAGVDHCWTRHPSLEASKDRCGQGEPTHVLEDEVLRFLSASLAESREPSFDIVSIKRNVSGDQDIAINRSSGSTFNSTNLPMAGVLMRAYGVKNIAGGPEWLGAERYDVAAKATGKPTLDEINAMLRRMFTDRLKLTAHIQAREISVYALEVARANHPGLKPLTLDCDAVRNEREAAQKSNQSPATASNGAPLCGFTWAGAFNSGGMTMPEFVSRLDFVAGRVVIDRTGMTGRYEFTVRFAPPGQGATARSDDAPDFFTAIQEQLGLRLRATRASVDTLVIDHIDRPEEN
jgi:uncharacterized protein (TIGR03435 family)